MCSENVHCFNVVIILPALHKRCSEFYSACDFVICVSIIVYALNVDSGPHCSNFGLFMMPSILSSQLLSKKDCAKIEHLEHNGIGFYLLYVISLLQ